MDRSEIWSWYWFEGYREAKTGKPNKYEKSENVLSVVAYRAGYTHGLTERK